MYRKMVQKKHKNFSANIELLVKEPKLYMNAAFCFLPTLSEDTAFDNS
jgi:hypothetical protein